MSSTGHLILASEIFGYDADQWKVSNVVIQLGAILACGGPVLAHLLGSWAWACCGGKRRASPSWRNILIAFLPSAVLGLAFKP
ncbi:MAG: undecaprenyl-diphosphate phosphatase [Novosphingobium sp.]